MQIRNGNVVVNVGRTVSKCSQRPHHHHRCKSQNCFHMERTLLDKNKVEWNEALSLRQSLFIAAFGRCAVLMTNQGHKSALLSYFLFVRAVWIHYYCFEFKNYHSVWHIRIYCFQLFAFITWKINKYNVLNFHIVQNPIFFRLERNRSPSNANESPWIRILDLYELRQAVWVCVCLVWA